MIPDIQKKKEEVKKIWQESYETMRTSDLFRQLLGDYFDVANWSISNKDWLFFLVWVREWKGAIKKKKEVEEVRERLRDLSDEEVEEIQAKNRRKMIVMLSRLIEEYESSGEDKNVRKKAISIAEIRRMYNSIQSLEEKMKMTQLSKGKLKLETVRTLLPYQRMTLPQTLELKSKLNESFDRIVKLKSGESVGQTPIVSG